MLYDISVRKDKWKSTASSIQKFFHTHISNCCVINTYKTMNYNDLLNVSLGQLAFHLEKNKVIFHLKLLTMLTSGKRIRVRESWRETYNFQKYMFYMIFIRLFLALDW